MTHSEFSPVHGTSNRVNQTPKKKQLGFNMLVSPRAASDPGIVWRGFIGVVLCCSALVACGADATDAPAGADESSGGGGGAPSTTYVPGRCDKSPRAEGGVIDESGGAGGAQSSELASAAGDWTYSFFSPDLPEAQIGKVILSQDGPSLSGDDGTGAVITGTVDGHQVTLTSTWDEGSNTFVGLLSKDGQTMAGTWSGSYGSGTFIATKH